MRIQRAAYRSRIDRVELLSTVYGESSLAAIVAVAAPGPKADLAAD